LCRMFADVWGWYQVTDGAFDPGIGHLLDAWDIHGEGTVPDPQRARRIRATSGLAQISFDARQCTLTKRADATFDVGAFGKGEALDRVASTIGGLPWMVDLGGQVSVGGTAPSDGWRVAVADPRDRERPFLHLRLTRGSLSTSGASERSLVVNGRRINHIFDPRTGTPAPFTGSVSVWHQQGLAADALSTALVVMGPDEGLRWAEAHTIAALYLIPNGSQTRIAATSAFNTADAVRLIGQE
jgi:FAD:protein FMN transferase